MFFLAVSSVRIYQLCDDRLTITLCYVIETVNNPFLTPLNGYGFLFFLNREKLCCAKCFRNSFIIPLVLQNIYGNARF